MRKTAPGIVLVVCCCFAGYAGEGCSKLRSSSLVPVARGSLGTVMVHPVAGGGQWAEWPIVPLIGCHPFACPLVLNNDCNTKSKDEIECPAKGEGARG